MLFATRASEGVVTGSTNKSTTLSPVLTASTGFGIVLAVCVVIGVVMTLVLIGKRQGLVVESVLLSVAAGLLYGLQDAATRASTVIAQHDGLIALLHTGWSLVVVGGAAQANVDQAEGLLNQAKDSLTKTVIRSPRRLAARIAVQIGIVNSIATTWPIGISVSAKNQPSCAL